MKKKVLFSAVVLLAASSAFAQGNGMAGITEATNMVTVLFRPGDKINLRHRCGGGLDWRRESVWQVFFGRP